MECFIPSWNKYDWELDYDPIANYAKILKKENEKYKLVVLNFLPMLSYQLNKCGIPISLCWRAFDSIQDINEVVGKPLTIEDLPFPPELERVYSPKNVLMIRKNKLFAKISLFANRVFNEISYYNDNEEVIFVEELDSRGFISRRKRYQNGQIVKIILYDFFGRSVLTMDGKQEHIEIMPASQNRFLKKEYANINEVVVEVTEKMLIENYNELGLVVPISAELLPITTQLQKKWPIAYVCTQSSFLDVNSIYFRSVFMNQLPIIVSSRKMAHRLHEVVNRKSIENTKYTIIPPYATNLSLGKSNALDFQIIFWNVHKMQINRFRKLLPLVLIPVMKIKDRAVEINLPDNVFVQVCDSLITEYIQKHYKIKIHTESFLWVRRYLKAKKERRLTSNMSEDLKKHQRQPNWRQMIRASEALDRIKVTTEHSADYYDQCMSKSRVLVDLDDEPSLYLQIKAISNGIPQINLAESEFVTDLENGFIVSDDQSLPKAIDFFLNSLNHWNKSLVESIKKIDIFSSTRIFKRISMALFGEEYNNDTNN